MLKSHCLYPEMSCSRDVMKVGQELLEAHQSSESTKLRKSTLNRAKSHHNTFRESPSAPSGFFDASWSFPERELLHYQRITQTTPVYREVT